MSKTLRWGILGTGAIARKFASELPHARTGVLAAVGSRTPEAAAGFVEKFPGIRAHGRYEDLLADPEVDAVYISTPHPAHAEWAIAAAEAGKHILCEKPMTMNHAEAMVVMEAARRGGVFFMEAFMYRCHPRTARLAELLREGVIGPVRIIRSDFSFAAGYRPESRLFNNALGGGGILDVGCYAASVVRLVAGAAAGGDFAEPIELTGSGLMAETGVDKVAVASLKFPGDMLAQISCGVALRQRADLRILGEAGEIHIAEFWNPPGPIHILNYETKETTVVETDANPYKYALEADAMAEALPALESECMSWDDSLGNMRVLDLWRAALKFEYEMEKPGAPELRQPVSRRPLQPGCRAEIPQARLAGLDKPVSRLVMGCDNQRTLPHFAAMADDFLERGGNAFDTAFIYGGGLMERLLGQWMADRGVRDQVVVTVKGAHLPLCDPKNLISQFYESLERLQTDRADIYMMHRDNPEIPVGEFVDVLDGLRGDGKVAIYGGSNWSMARLQEANAYAARTGREPFRVVSNNLSLARMIDPVWSDCVSAKGPEWRDWLLAHKMAVFSWSSQARGYFAPNRQMGSVGDAEIARCWDSEDNRERRRRALELAAERQVSPLNIALAWVLAQPFPAFALFGPRTIAETRTGTPGARFPLSEREAAWLDLEAPDCR